MSNRKEEESGEEIIVIKQSKFIEGAVNFVYLEGYIS